MAEVLPARLPKDFVWSITGRKHVNYSPEEEFEGSPATFQGYHDLGLGGQGTVSVVKVKSHLIARKRMDIDILDEECKREAKILESIIHKHVIQLIGSYTWNHRFYLLLYPIADCNLKELMARERPTRDIAWETQMKEGFGCLAGAIAFLHSKRVAIKHKDIKPSNILFFKNSPILTDFGLSSSFMGRENSFSIGATGKSVMYAAPEVIAETQRGTSQDIFSLGLVFQDMFWALHGRAKTKPSDENGNTRQEPFSGICLEQNELNFCQNLGKLVFDELETLQGREAFVTVMRGMLSKTPEDRPTANTLWYFLSRTSTYFGKSCGACCLDNHAAENTSFQTWTGLASYSPMTVFQTWTDNEPHYPMTAVSPFDDPLQDRIRLVDDASREGHEDDTVVLNRVAPEFDWSGRGHFHVENLVEQEVPITAVSVLGQGAFGYVDAIICRTKLLARKSIRITRSQLIVDVCKEIDMMRRLQHPHVVQVIGSYTNRRTLSFLMTPVCEYNLYDFMELCHSNPQDPAQRVLARRNRLSLKRSMACLAQALEYIHDNFIRHKDIKPRNVLVKKGTEYAHMYFADFGIGVDFADMTSSQTVGPSAFTKRYAAPEVRKYMPRGRASDIFSLGCVFLEMQATVLSIRVDGLSFFKSGEAYAFSLDAVKDFMEEKLFPHSGIVQGLRFTRKHIHSVLDLISKMMSESPQLRPAASDVAHSLGSNECCHLDVEQPSDMYPTQNLGPKEPLFRRTELDEAEMTIRPK